MKVIFLDIDGVLNSSEYLHKLGGRVELIDRDLDHAVRQIDPEKVKLLDHIIVAAGGANIVICSSWRYFYSIQQFQEIFHSLDSVAHILGATRRRKTSIESRGAHIADWIETGRQQYGIDVEQFCIIDDGHDVSPFMPFHVQPEYNGGMTEAHAEKAIRLLNQEGLII